MPSRASCSVLCAVLFPYGRGSRGTDSDLFAAFCLFAFSTETRFWPQKSDIFRASILFGPRKQAGRRKLTPQKSKTFAVFVFPHQGPLQLSEISFRRHTRARRTVHDGKNCAGQSQVKLSKSDRHGWPNRILLDRVAQFHQESRNRIGWSAQRTLRAGREASFWRDAFFASSRLSLYYWH